MIQTLFSSPLAFIFTLLGLVIVITVHEFSHALAAEHLGDPTPRLQGRLSLNPLRHLDPLGTLLIVFVGFGWGKPVMFDPFNLQNMRRDAALISLAGPVSNFILALILALLSRLIILFHISALTTIGLPFLFITMKISLLLGVFNLIPVHPLDGFKIVGGILPKQQADEWYQLQRYGYIILILLIFPLNGRVSILDMILQPIFNLLLPFFMYISSASGIM